MTPLTDAELDLMQKFYFARHDDEAVHRAITELRELRKRTCAICGDSGKLDDAQAWDEGQEPSDCPYCPERLDELRAENAALVAALETYGHHIPIPNECSGPEFIECACQRSWEPEDCDCGFDAALASVRGDA